MNNQRLYRSRTNKVFAGVCGGLAEYFDIDPVIMRILFVLLVVFGGSGILLYIAGIIIIPKKPFQIDGGDQPSPGSQEPSNVNARNWFGYALIGGGAILLFTNLGIFHFVDFLDSAFEYIFPILLIVLGMAIIYYRQAANSKSEADPSPVVETGFSAPPSNARSFRRSSSDRKLFGVCGGLANYFGVDPSMMRLLYVILCIASFGAGLLLYILLAIAVPDDKFINARVS